MPDKINLTEKFSRFTEQWSPKILGQVNDTHIKVVKIQGEFLWHSHEHEDEMFLVVDGAMTMRFRDHDVELTHGECIIVPRGVEHMPVAEKEASILLVEPAGTVNTGDDPSERMVVPEHI